MVTTPQHEKVAVRHLDSAGVETFLPTYETPRAWNNRQKVNVLLRVFPTYLLVRIDHRDRGKVFRTPGVQQFVGTSREALSLSAREIGVLRAGAMQGAEGCLVRKNSEWRFVLTVETIHHHVAVEVDASTVEPIVH